MLLCNKHSNIHLYLKPSIASTVPDVSRCSHVDSTTNAAIVHCCYHRFVTLRRSITTCQEYILAVFPVQKC